MRQIFPVVAALAALVLGGCMGGRPAILRPAAVPVPPSQEIEVLDPAQGATNVPPVVLTGGEGGTQQVDVPPAILVHRYFPTGDRTFQAQFLPGGPCIVSVNHPRTLERTYTMVTLPPGAPRVTYTGKSIIYDYGPQSVTLSFGPLGKPTVTYSQGLKAVERVKAVGSGITNRVGNLLSRFQDGDVPRE